MQDAVHLGRFIRPGFFYDHRINSNIIFSYPDSSSINSRLVPFTSKVFWLSKREKKNYKYISEHFFLDAGVYPSCFLSCWSHFPFCVSSSSRSVYLIEFRLF